MASEIGVQKLMHTNATQAATINSSGQLIIDDGLHKSGSVNTSIGDGLAKVYFKYTQATPAVNDSLNISSITDNSTGSLTPNYTNSFDSVHYGVSQSSQSTLKYHGTYATGSILFRTRNYSNSDVDEVSGGAMFGDLA